MRDVRAAWEIGGGNRRVTRRGLVFGTFGLVTAAVLARPVAAVGRGDDPFGRVLGAPPPIGFRLVLKSGEVCRFRRAEGLTLPGILEWEVIKALQGPALSPDDADLDRLMKGGDRKGDGSKTWVTKWNRASEHEQHNDPQARDENHGPPFTITLSEGTKADPALYAWYEDGDPRLSSPNELKPKLFPYQPGVQGSAPLWTPLSPTTGQTESPPTDKELPPTPAVRNPVIFAFRNGKAIARFRLLGATIEGLLPAPGAVGASERPVKELTLVCEQMLVTLRDS